MTCPHANAHTHRHTVYKYANTTRINLLSRISVTNNSKHTHTTHTPTQPHTHTHTHTHTPHHHHTPPHIHTFICDCQRPFITYTQTIIITLHTHSKHRDTLVIRLQQKK